MIAHALCATTRLLFRVIVHRAVSPLQNGWNGNQLHSCKSGNTGAPTVSPRFHWGFSAFWRILHCFRENCAVVFITSSHTMVRWYDTNSITGHSGSHHTSHHTITPPSPSPARAAHTN